MRVCVCVCVCAFHSAVHTCFIFLVSVVRVCASLNIAGVEESLCCRLKSTGGREGGREGGRQTGARIKVGGSRNGMSGIVLPWRERQTEGGKGRGKMKKWWSHKNKM